MGGDVTSARAMAGSGETGRSHRWIAVDLAISFGCSLAAVLAVITDQPLLAFVPVAGIGAILTIGRGHRESLLAVIREQRADVLGEAERMRMFAEVTRVVTASGDVRQAVCTAARSITGASGAFLVEPDGQGNLVTTAVAGDTMPPFVLGPQDRSVTSQVMASPRYLFEADLSAGSSPADESLMGAASAAWQPVQRNESMLGVLGLIFDARTDYLPKGIQIMLEALAASAAGAIERDDLAARLTLVADRDPLTGLPNRRRWDETCSAESARAERTDSRLTFVLVELNEVSGFTERFGQLAGEGLLRQFASSVQNVLREEDTIAHWGGAVFAVALPACSAQDASFVAKRVRDVVPPGQTCTIGIAEWKPGKELDQVLEEAEMALSGDWPAARAAVHEWSDGQVNAVTGRSPVEVTSAPGPGAGPGASASASASASAGAGSGDEARGRRGRRN